MEYTLSLALLDYLPVLFTASGLIAITRMIAHIDSSQGMVAHIGTILTISGGFFKATWKLFMALSNGSLNITWMDDGLFVFMAPGYTLLGWSVWQTVRNVRGKKPFHPWHIPLAMTILMFAISGYLLVSRPESPAWERVLLSVMVLATIITGIFLIIFSFRQKLYSAGWLFIFNLFCILILNGLARMEDQTIALQWIEEGINAVSWLAFAIAANRVYKFTRANFGVDPETLRAVSTAR
ncbi:MAG TPA: hypothetical protein DCX53_01020 [Anaerolineae bacterium]|nr:hypothetical protein [Anaerolineae bacterium]